MLLKDNNSGRSVTADDIHAYVDGQLSPERAAIVKAYIAENGDAAAQEADYRLINEAIRTQLDDALDRPLPFDQVALLRRRTVWRVRPVAAALGWMVIGTALGWGIAMRAPGPGVLDQLASRSTAAYGVFSPEVLHPVEVSADQTVHLSEWLTNRMGRQVSIPQLSGLGFDLVGGRLLVDADAPAAMLMYQKADGRRIVVYVSRQLSSDRPTGMKFRREMGSGVVTWANDRGGVAVVGGFTEDELIPAARLIQAALAT